MTAHAPAQADTQIVALSASNSPVEILGLGDDADRYVEAVAVMPIEDTGEVLREHVTLRSGITYERICVGAADAVIWMSLGA